MKKNLETLSPPKCQYIHNSECGRPDKDFCMICNSDMHVYCPSYKCLEDCKKRKEEKKDGKQDAGESA